MTNSSRLKSLKNASKKEASLAFVFSEIEDSGPGELNIRTLEVQQPTERQDHVVFNLCLRVSSQEFVSIRIKENLT